MNADFFATENVSKKTETRAAIPPQLQYLRSPCECGAGGGWRFVNHYDVVQCRCGKRYWALQPKRDGAFVAFPHPGFVAGERAAA